MLTAIGRQTKGQGRDLCDRSISPCFFIEKSYLASWRSVLSQFHRVSLYCQTASNCFKHKLGTDVTVRCSRRLKRWKLNERGVRGFWHNTPTPSPSPTRENRYLQLRSGMGHGHDYVGGIDLIDPFGSRMGFS